MNIKRTGLKTIVGELDENEKDVGRRLFYIVKPVSFYKKDTIVVQIAYIYFQTLLVLIFLP